MITPPQPACPLCWPSRCLERPRTAKAWKWNCPPTGHKRRYDHHPGNDNIILAQMSMSGDRPSTNTTKTAFQQSFVDRSRPVYTARCMPQKWAYVTAPIAMQDACATVMSWTKVKHTHAGGHCPRAWFGLRDPATVAVGQWMWRHYRLGRAFIPVIACFRQPDEIRSSKHEIPCHPQDEINLWQQCVSQIPRDACASFSISCKNEQVMLFSELYNFHFVAIKWTRKTNFHLNST